MIAPRQAKRLDLVGFAQAGGRLEGVEPLRAFPRLAAELVPDGSAPALEWSCTGESKTGHGGSVEPWLHLRAGASMPLQCQRCLETVLVPVALDRRFRFVVGEEAAAREDESSEEDVLAFQARFDLYALIEDELLMALPMVPRHDACQPSAWAHLADEAQDVKVAEHPFAGLDALKR